jgi:DNA replication and repair protein RecF
MPFLHELRLENFRILGSAQLKLERPINFLYGHNGAGKTSVLEAIHLLSTGKSFLTNSFRSLVQDGQSSFTLFSRFVDEEGIHHQLGLSREARGDSKIKLDSDFVRSAAKLSETFPVLCLDAHSFEFLDGSPGSRRRLLEWLVFHVEHNYIILWRDYQNCLKQRNGLLRRGKISRLEIDPWDKQLANLGAQIETLRNKVFKEYQSQLKEYLRYFGFLSDIDIRYKDGWGLRESDQYCDESQLMNRLKENFERDLQLGHSSIGAHRFDIGFRSEGKALKEHLSRGQKKSVLLAIVLSMAHFYYENKNKKPIMLYDDLVSELDEQNLSLLLRWICEFNAQSFVTGVSDKQFAQQLEQDYSRFHVEHGNIRIR